ncbi:MAG: A/G-specific adenine glycosylase [Verrucomicrobiales bacterium]|nr:A/G-specific adenine glycosylase [Verrucomicrobiales bacterium]
MEIEELCNKDSLFASGFPNREAVRDFQLCLKKWFVRVGEDYPWRQTTDPYAILVSELMLQQTRVATVLGRGYFSRWMQQFPDWRSLAGAGEGEILKAWEGLGYYNRARNLQTAAKQVCHLHGGELPSDYEAILALPGVGRYTAGAVLSFAFDQRAAIVDGNVIRVLTRIMGFEEPVDTSAAGKRIWEWAGALTPGKEVRVYNSAIMELGQHCCTKSSPRCSECPVSGVCAGFRSGTAEKIPRKKKKQTITEKVEWVGLLISKGKILLEKEGGTRRNGLWSLPPIEPEEAADWVEYFRFSYAITRYRMDLRVFQVPELSSDPLASRSSAAWFPLHGDLSGLPALGSPYRKAIEKFLHNNREELEWR